MLKISIKIHLNNGRSDRSIQYETNCGEHEIGFGQKEPTTQALRQRTLPISRRIWIVCLNYCTWEIEKRDHFFFFSSINLSSSSSTRSSNSLTCLRWAFSNSAKAFLCSRWRRITSASDISPSSTTPPPADLSSFFALRKAFSSWLFSFSRRAIAWVPKLPARTPTQKSRGSPRLVWVVRGIMFALWELGFSWDTMKKTGGYENRLTQHLLGCRWLGNGILQGTGGHDPREPGVIGPER